MDTLILRRRGQEVRRFPLGHEIVEVGRDRRADISVDDPELADRAVLIHATRGSVYVYTLSERRLRARVLPLDGELPLGREHTLVRARGGTSPDRRRTTHNALHVDPVTRWTVWVGRGPEARRAVVADQPLRVGSAADNDLVLPDPTVSAHHCRLEPTGRDLVVRDLDSRNGTYMDGVQVERARIRRGAWLRLGHTQLRVVGAVEGGGAEGNTFVAASAPMQALISDAERFAALGWPTLVLGPSGAGKEEVAAHLHRTSPRRRGAFVALNAGGLPENLIESELFGHERGAFTGAAQSHRGVFEQADGGTLFLDEIGELPLALQARLLRVLETWSVRRVGAERETRVDVRLVCATHRDLASMVARGHFRQDLYYRLNQLVLRVPALRERPEDILPLADHFLAQIREELGERTLSPEARARLLAHDYPGNARELRNLVCAAAALGAGPTLTVRDIEAACERLGSRPRRSPAEERPRLQRAVAEYGGNLSAAARALGLPRSTLRDRLKAG